MKPSSADKQTQSAEWPRTLRNTGDEFQQSFAVAQLAVRLCVLKKEQRQKQWEAEDKKYSTEYSNTVGFQAGKDRLHQERVEQMGRRMEQLEPSAFLGEAWTLIQSAREHVSRPQSVTEYLVEQGATDEARTAAARHLRKLREPKIPFQKLCDAERDKGDTELISRVSWRVYRSERGFDKLFWDYWAALGEMWKSADEENKSIPLHSESERAEMASIARDPNDWKERGKLRLDRWKSEGVESGDFRLLAEFRRDQDNRAANLKKPKPKQNAREAGKNRNTKA